VARRPFPDFFKLWLGESFAKGEERKLYRFFGRNLGIVVAIICTCAWAEGYALVARFKMFNSPSTGARARIGGRRPCLLFVIFWAEREFLLVLP